MLHTFIVIPYVRAFIDSAIGTAMDWAQEEWATAELGDWHLNRRLIKVAQQLEDKP